MVIKLELDVEVVMVLDRMPEPFEAGQPIKLTKETFNRPTDLALDAAGNIILAGSYSRALKHYKNGRFLKTCGQRGSSREIILPHSIGTDSDGLVYIAHRQNDRIQISDTDELPEATINLVSPWKLCLTPGRNKTLNAADGDQNESSNWMFKEYPRSIL